MTAEALAWARARSIENEAGCWIWQKALSNHGYPVAGYKGRTTSAYRIVWEELNGPAPAGWDLHHECREPRCVNPEHLLPVTRHENQLIGWGDRDIAPRCHVCRDCRSARVGHLGARCWPCRRIHLAANRKWTKPAVIAAFQRYAAAYGRSPSATHWNPALARRFGRADLAERFERDGCWPTVTTVQQHFGSWSAGLAAAGLQPHPAGAPGHENPQGVPVDLGLAADLRRARRARGWSQERLAVAIGTDQPMISLWEQGRRGIRPERLAAAFAALGMGEVAA